MNKGALQGDVTCEQCGKDVDLVWICKSEDPDKDHDLLCDACLSVRILDLERES